MKKFIVERTWTTKAGYVATCILIPDMYRCGYVAIPSTNILHGVGYSQSTVKLRHAWKSIMKHEREDNKRGPMVVLLAACAGEDSPKNWSPDMIFNIHGGLTYSGGGNYPIENPDNLWVFEFDCGHAGDGTLIPYFKNDPTMEECPVRKAIIVGLRVIRIEHGLRFMHWVCGVHRTEFVVAECEILAEKLKAFERSGIMRVLSKLYSVVIEFLRLINGERNEK